MSKPLFVRRAAWTCLLAALLVSLLVLFRTKPLPALPPSPLAQASAEAVEMPVSPAPDAIPGKARPVADAASFPPLSSRHVWLPAEGGSTYALALDEAMARDAEGRETILRLDPPASAATLPDRLRELAGPDRSILPVAYPLETPRDPYTRRLVTPDLRVQWGDTPPRELARRVGAIVADLPAHAPGWAVFSTADAFAALQAMSRLRASGHASADVLLAARRSQRAMPNDPLVSRQWHFQNANNTRTHINADSVWNYPAAQGIRGSGIRIAIVDDGVQTNHPDFVGNIDTVNDWDWNGNDGDPSPGFDDDHGTPCAGNAAARGNNGVGVTGSAPEAVIVGFRLISGSPTDAQEAQAMARSNDIIPIKSNSWGPPDTGDWFEAPGSLTRAAFADGVANGRGGLGTIYVWAGGNGGDVSDNSNYDGYANLIQTIAIGATDSTGNRAYYSEPGANIVLCAPSDGVVGITTTDRTGAAGENPASSANGGDYTHEFGGTSSATPTVSGVIALMLQANPQLGWRDVQEILIRSAHKPVPTSSGWATNGAGLRFHHDFGAGLVDAAAATSLATGWTRLDPAESFSLTSAESTPIPDNNAAGVTRSFDMSSSNLRVEHVTIRVAANHPYRGDLEIILTSPSGMSSRLAERRSDATRNYSNWTFSSVRHWGETSSGTWSVRVADRASQDIGSLGTVVLTLHGAPIPPANPPPFVRIVSPENASLFSPGSSIPVLVEASDRKADGSADTVERVELHLNGSLVATATTPPYQFEIQPPPGTHALTARAWDPEGLESTSASVTVTVANQAPVLHSVSLSAHPQAYADEGLSASSWQATDPENDLLSATYRWQSSADGERFVHEPSHTSASLPADPALAGRLWRCIVSVSDGELESASLTSAATNLLRRPPAEIPLGRPFSHNSGLVLRSDGAAITRQAILQEFSQGPPGSTAEWVEILVLQSGSLAGWSLNDASGNSLTLRPVAPWTELTAGTVIVIHNGDAKDPLLGPQDLDLSDGRLLLPSTSASHFTGAWPGFGNAGDAVILRSDEGQSVHQFCYGNSTAAPPNLGAIGSGAAVFFTGSSDADAGLSAFWSSTPATTPRSSSAAPGSTKITRAPGDLFFSEYVHGSGTLQAVEIYNPGNTDVSLRTANYTIEIYSNGSTTRSYNLTFIYNNASATNVPAQGTLVIKRNDAALADTPGFNHNSLIFDGNDTIRLLKNGTVVDRIGQLGNNPAGGAWTANGVSTKNQTLRRKSSISTGETNSGSAFDPSVQWEAFPLNTISGLASHYVGPLTLSLSLSATSVSESAGPGALSATLSIPTPRPAAVVVSLTSSDESEILVPASLTLAAGQTQASFLIDTVDDSLADGTQSVEIRASASGFTDGTAQIEVTDDEGGLSGVTPGQPNTPANAEFVSELRSGVYSIPARHRLGAGTSLPAGLVFDPETGTLHGSPDPALPAGDYPVTVERHNDRGEVVSHSFLLHFVSAAGNDFAAWIAAFPQLGSATGPLDDPDADGLPNAIEALLGTPPHQANPGLDGLRHGAEGLHFQHPLHPDPPQDLSLRYQWSPDLQNWLESDAAHQGLRVHIDAETSPDGLQRQVRAHITQGGASRIFLRLAASQVP